MSRLTGISFYRIREETIEIEGEKEWTVRLMIKYLKEARLQERWEHVSTIIALIIYGAILCPSRTSRVHASAVNLLFEMQNEQLNPVPALLAETIIGLNLCKKGVKTRFQGSATLLFLWICSHISGDYSIKVPNRRLQAFDRLRWEHKLAELNKDNIWWRIPSSKIAQVLIQCGTFRCVPLIGIRGCITYTPLLVLRKFGYHQIIPAMAPMRDQEICSGDAKYQATVFRYLAHWKKVHTHIPILTEEDFRTLDEYEQWRVTRTIVPPRDQATRECPKNPKPQNKNEENSTQIRELQEQLEAAHEALADLRRNRALLEQTKDELVLKDLELIEERATSRALKKQCHELNQDQLTSKRKMDDLLAQKEELVNHQGLRIRQLCARLIEKQEEVDGLEEEVQARIQQSEAYEDSIDVLRGLNHQLTTRMRELEDWIICLDRIVHPVKTWSRPIYDAINDIAEGITNVEKKVPILQAETVGLDDLKARYKRMTKLIAQIQHS